GPTIVVARPRGHAMDVGDELGLWQRHERRPVELERLLDQPVDDEAPARRRDVRLHAEIEDRPGLDFALAGRQALDVRPALAAGQQPALPSPALLAVHQLLPDLAGHVVVAIHGCLPTVVTPSTRNMGPVRPAGKAASGMSRRS